MAKKINILNSEQEQKYNSLFDEIQRNKRIKVKLKFKISDKEILWNALVETFKRTFRIKRELEIGMEFGLKIGAVYSRYTLDKFDVDKKIIYIKWTNNEDKYWMEFAIKNRFFYSKKLMVKVTEDICKSTPFWGLQDTAGLMWMKKTLKTQMKTFKKSIIFLLNENDSNASTKI